MLTKTRCSVLLLASVGGFALMARPSYADYIDLASYANNNIYTDLNENFPNTGAGTPGSHTGVANATYLFTPWTYIPPAAATSGVSYTSFSAPLGNNGISFQLNSNSTGQDFAQIGDAGGGAYTGPSPITVTIGVNGVTTVSALMSAYNGQSFSVTFTGTGGSETFSNVLLADFNGGTAPNSCASGVCDQTVYTVHDQGGGGTGNSTTGDTTTYDLTEVTFTLDSALAAGELTSATFTSNGYETLLFGLTTESAASSQVPEPSSLALLGTALLGLVGFTFLHRRKRT